MKDKIFWSLLVSVGLSVWNVAFSQRPRLDLIAEPAATKASAADSLHVMDADGRNLRPFVSHPEYTSHGSPAWSCDGSTLAFDAWRSAQGETYVNAHIFVCNADGAQLKDIGVGAMPSWSPDGNRIVFSNYSPRGVWIMNADGTGRELLDADGWGGEWCPKGERSPIRCPPMGQISPFVIWRPARRSPCLTIATQRFSGVWHGRPTASGSPSKPQHETEPPSWR